MLRQLLSPLLDFQAPHPPALATPFGTAQYIEFMKAESFLLSPSYARRRVRIHGVEHLRATRERGGLLAALHIGSFFLSGGALVHQLGLPYTCVASRHNLRFTPGNEADFWLGVHQRSESLYGTPMFYTDESVRKSLSWLEENKYLGVAIDVRENGIRNKEDRFSFLGQDIYVHTGPGRLARISGRPMLPMTILFDSRRRVHDLHIGAPVLAATPHACIQQTLDQMAPLVVTAQQQFFHDLLGMFATPHRVD